MYAGVMVGEAMAMVLVMVVAVGGRSAGDETQAICGTCICMSPTFFTDNRTDKIPLISEVISLLSLEKVGFQQIHVFPK